MQDNNLKDQNAAKLNRRKFLTRAGVGLVVASLPAKSVWAGSHGLAASIMASGHGSDFAGGNKIRLCLPHDLSKFYSSQCKDSFYQSFGNKNPFISNVSNGNLRKLRKITFSQIFSNSKYAGVGDINVVLATIYLNATLCSGNPNGTGIYYPIIGTGKAFSSKEALTAHLHREASRDAFNTAVVLKKFINNPNV